MQRIFKQIIGVMFLFLVQEMAIAQQLSFSEALPKIQGYYDKVSNYTLETTYKMYKGVSGNTITESYKAQIIKNEDVSKVEVFDTEIVQFPEYQLVLDHKKKTMTVKKLNEQLTQNTILNIETTTKYFKVAKTTTEGNLIVYELVPQEKTFQLQYNKILLFVDSSDYSVKKQHMYLANKIPFADNGGKRSLDEARMEVLYENIASKNQRKPKLKDYIVLIGNGQPLLAKPYADYTIN